MRGGAARGTLSELMMAILSYVSQDTRTRAAWFDVPGELVRHGGGGGGRRLDAASKKVEGRCWRGEFWPSSVPARRGCEQRAGCALRANKHRGRSADNDAAAGAGVEEARDGPWRDSQGFLPVTLHDEQSTRPLSATLPGADWWACGSQCPLGGRAWPFSKPCPEGRT